MPDHAIVKDLPAAGLCTKGGRTWFTAHGLDWSDFVKNGISLEILAGTACPLAARVIAAAESRIASERGLSGQVE